MESTTTNTNPYAITLSPPTASANSYSYPQHAAPQQKPSTSPASATDFQPTITPGSLSDRFGKWSYAHKEDMNGWLPNYALRNAANAAVALGALTAVIVPTRLGMNALKNATAEAGKFTGFKTLDSAIHEVVKTPDVPGIVGVGLSFSTFRTLFKVGKRNYDRLFGDNSAYDNAVAFHDLPRNIAKDIGEIAPIEFPATCLAAIPLVTIRNRFGGPAQPSTLRDIVGSIPAYTVFFEMTERLYSGFSKDTTALQGIFKEATPTPKPADDKDRKPYAVFTEDTPVRMAFRKLPAVGLGIAAYISLNRGMYKAQAQKLVDEGKLTLKEGEKVSVPMGGMNPDKDTLRSGFGKEIKPFLMFPAYTVISEAWINAYDKLFENLQNKYQKNHRSM